ncbi:MAG: RrF2 family transcriptional regulator [Myxococcota bacterium]
MRATQRLRYAIYGAFDLAYHGSSKPVPIQVIGARQRIPARYLEQIFQRLRRAGLVQSKRGPGGGYCLARDPAEITLADLARAVEGSLLQGVPEPSPEDGSTGPDFVWERLADALESALSEVSLAALCREAAQRRVGRADAGPSMYHI